MMSEAFLLKLARKIKWPTLRLGLLRKIYRRHHLQLQEFTSYQNDRFFIYKIENEFIPNESLTVLSPNLVFKKCRNESLAIYEPRKGDIILDIGAGLGEEVLCYSKLTGNNGTVYAIEANPAVFEILQKTVELNGLNNVRSFNLAIYEKKGTVQLETSNPSYEAAHLKESTGISSIQAIRMDEFLDNLPIDRVDFLKVNIEGAERFVVDTMGQENFKKIRHLAIACHDFRFRQEENEFFKTREHVIAVLERNGFRIQTRNTGTDYLDDWIYGTNKI